MVCTTSPTADNLISRILEKSRLRSSSADRVKRSLLRSRCCRPRPNLSADRQDHLQHALERRRGVVAQHGDLAVAGRGEPVELNDAALAGERLVAMPGIIAAF